MKALLQRVTRASVDVDGERVGAVDRGLLVFLGVLKGDGEEQARALAGRVARFRLFADERGRMNRSLLDVGAGALVVSQFTLAHDGRPGGGRRPSFDRAAPPAEAERLYELFVATLRELGAPVETGRFGALMAVELCNDGPVTFLLEDVPPSPAGGPADAGGPDPAPRS